MCELIGKDEVLLCMSIRINHAWINDIRVSVFTRRDFMCLCKRLEH